MITSDELEQWLKAMVATRTRLSPDAIDVNLPLDELGIDSMEAVALAGELETLLKRRVEPTVLWDYRTLRALSRALTGEQQAPPPSATDSMSDAEVEALLRKMTGTKS
ncbi:MULTISPECIES: acyl carrier protein [Stigmatella]|uniref:Phthiocerol/phenolphthiocerol synthesis type-I polyketide synthase D n=1 Tax=Stigmatella erecta TaxID=83460 RepID=A0A1I0KWH5_9BACT|nr:MULTISPECIES: acyl carrier protein [Stigmatella]SEU30394.1 phthiocerol/phenolphthiocerol synthesis type-I polyketide synthase D [Stigmatella erecta]